jgi:hypothetical protein
MSATPESLLTKRLIIGNVLNKKYTFVNRRRNIKHQFSSRASDFPPEIEFERCDCWGLMLGRLTDGGDNPRVGKYDRAARGGHPGNTARPPGYSRTIIAIKVGF